MAADAIFHITSRAEWEAAIPTGEYRPAAFAREGFIHCSYDQQVDATRRRHFNGRSGLVLLEINRAVVQSPIVDENLSGGVELFPHIYGSLPVSAVVAVRDL
ncbi:MAG TPA: DUF952 domain-containing protein [Vicinamibacterales bacterium]|nr:DUF952 domain-containing protein [Vicinamibacterales bacterium]